MPSHMTYILTQKVNYTQCTGGGANTPIGHWHSSFKTGTPTQTPPPSATPAPRFFIVPVHFQSRLEHCQQSGIDRTQPDNLSSFQQPLYVVITPPQRSFFRRLRFVSHDPTLRALQICLLLLYYYYCPAVCLSVCLSVCMAVTRLNYVTKHRVFCKIYLTVTAEFVVIQAPTRFGVE